MTFAICFDFPESDDPVFAGWFKDTIGFAPTLATAIRFEDEVTAERTLSNSYPATLREFGVVVEVGA